MIGTQNLNMKLNILLHPAFLNSVFRALLSLHWWWWCSPLILPSNLTVHNKEGESTVYVCERERETPLTAIRVSAKDAIWHLMFLLPPVFYITWGNDGGNEEKSDREDREARSDDVPERKRERECRKSEMRKRILIFKQLFLNFGAITEAKSVCRRD